MTNRIDGKAFAARLRQDVARRVAHLKEEGIVPGLAVVLLGEDAASQVYVASKAKHTVECGMQSFEHKMPATTTQEQLLQLIDQLNADRSVHGILVQLPLPKHIDSDRVVNAISPDKDVDGFCLLNVARLSIGVDCIVPCTPLGCLMLLQDHLGDLSGKHALVLGRSNIVGKPMAALLLRENCTVTIAHSRTHNLPDMCRQADILVAAVGRPKMVQGSWIKPGAVVIDVGINRIELPDGKTKLVGDVDYDSAMGIAGAITPVPGGVGPMTIAVLLHNTLQQCARIEQVALPA